MVVSATDPFLAKGTVPDTAAGFCDYSGATPERVSYATGAKFETAQTDAMVPMAPFYFPLVYNTPQTTGNAFRCGAALSGVRYELIDHVESNNVDVLTRSNLQAAIQRARAHGQITAAMATRS